MDKLEQELIHEEKMEKISELFEDLILDAVLSALSKLKKRDDIDKLIEKEMITGQINV